MKQEATMTLPAKRLIESSSFGDMWEPDVTEEEAAQIRDAISRGRLIFFVCSKDAEKYTSNHREVDLTYYRDPASGEFRYAVETWLGARKWTHDFADPAEAHEQVDTDRRMVSL